MRPTDHTQLLLHTDVFVFLKEHLASYCSSFWGCQVGTPGIILCLPNLTSSPYHFGGVTSPENVWQSSRILQKAHTMGEEMWWGKRELFPTTQYSSCHLVQAHYQAQHCFPSVFSGYWRKVRKTGLGEEPVLCEWEQQQPACKAAGVSDGFIIWQWAENSICWEDIDWVSMSAGEGVSWTRKTCTDWTFAFCSYFLCEVTFSALTYLKNKWGCRLVLENNLLTAVSTLAPELPKLMKDKQGHVSY